MAMWADGDAKDQACLVQTLLEVRIKPRDRWFDTQVSSLGVIVALRLEPVMRAAQDLLDWLILAFGHPHSGL
jgi:hypothetical protein